MEGFRQIGSVKEFFGDLRSLKKAEHCFVIWQNIKGSKKITEGNFYSCSKVERNMVIDLKISSNLAFVQENPIYLYEEESGILFKGDYKYCINGLLRILADDTIFMKERRVLERQNFLYTQVFLGIESVKKPLGEEYLLRNISASGVGIIVPLAQAMHFRKGDEISITMIKNIKLPKPITGKVMHVTAIQPKKAKAKLTHMNVGFEFDTKSPLIENVMNAVRLMPDD